MDLGTFSQEQNAYLWKMSNLINIYCDQPQDRLYSEHQRYSSSDCKNSRPSSDEGGGNHPDDTAANVFVNLHARQIPQNHIIRYHFLAGTVGVLHLCSFFCFSQAWERKL